MADWPEVAGNRVLKTITTHDSLKGSGVTIASAAWPTANKAYYSPVFVPRRFLARQFFVPNGGTASGNFDVGLYSIDGTKIISTGSTAQSGTTDCQVVDTTDLLLPAGWYYLALAMNGTTGTVLRNNTFSANVLKSLGCAMQTSAFPLPATATFATITDQFLPVFGMLGGVAL